MKDIIPASKALELLDSALRAHHPDLRAAVFSNQGRALIVESIDDLIKSRIAEAVATLGKEVRHE